MPFKHDEEKNKLVAILQKELPENVKFEWEMTGALKISQVNTLMRLDYKNSPYPDCKEDIDKVLTTLKATFK